MIKRITVENYMAHKRSTIELAEGVTVITGPNNSGKSALVEAIRSVAQNPPSGRHAVRHGARSAVVRIELDTGEAVEWERTEKTALYRIYPGEADGSGSQSPEVFAKFGRFPPDDVRRLLRLDLVETETGPVDIHIGNQRYPIFLLDQSGSQAASFFAASTEAEYLLRMQQALKTKTDETRRRRKDLAGRCVRLEGELRPYEALDLVAPVLDAAEEIFERIRSNAQTLPLVEDLVDRLASTLERLEIETDRQSVLDGLQSPPILHETPGHEELLRRLEDTAATLTLVWRNQSALSALTDPPAPEDLRPLEQLVFSLARVSRDREETASRIEVLESMDPPPDLQDVEPLAGLVQELGRNRDRWARCSTLCRGLEPLRDPPELEAVRDLHAVVSSLEELTRSQSRIHVRSSRLRSLEEPPEAWDPTPLKDLIRVLEDLEIGCRRTRKRCETTERLQPVPTPGDTRDLEETVLALEKTRDHLKRTGDRLSLLQATEPCPQLHPLKDLDEWIAEESRLQNEQSRLERRHAECLKAIQRKKKEIEGVLREIGACPLCGQAFDLTHFLEKDHG